jgi:DNA-binding MarR family transcriptional regulator
MKPTARKKSGVVQLPVAENFARIAASAQAIVNAADAILRDRGAQLGLADWALLQLLAAQSEPLPMGRIAVQIGVSRQRIQKQAEALAQAKYIQVQVTADDKRVRMVKLTRQGADALKAISAQWNDPLAKDEAPAKLKNLDVLRVRFQRIAHILGRVQRDNAQGSVPGKPRPRA